MSRYTPYARYLLIFLSAWLLASGDIPAPFASVIADMAVDPVIVADVAGAISALVAVVWYQISRAKAALDLDHDLRDPGNRNFNEYL